LILFAGFTHSGWLALLLPAFFNGDAACRIHALVFDAAGKKSVTLW
jgi:hypothetical protein